MSRVALSVALLFLATSGFAQNKKAGALNDEGKDLYADKKDYEGAAALDKLLCDLALEQCDQVFAHQPKPELAQKTGEKGADIRKNMKTAEAGTATGPETGTGQTPPPPTPPQPVPPTAPPTTGQQPNAPNAPTTTQPPRPGGAPVNPEGYESAVDLEGRYGWALGVSLGFVHHTYGDTSFQETGLNLDLHADRSFGASSGSAFART